MIDTKSAEMTCIPSHFTDLSVPNTILNVNVYMPLFVTNADNDQLWTNKFMTCQMR